MAFRTPSVRVYQELVSTSISPITPFMDLCIVGPVYQCEEGVACDDYVLSAGENYTSVYPEQALGSKMDVKSVVVSLSDVYVKIWPAAPSTYSAAVVINNNSDVTPVSTVTGAVGHPFSESDIKIGDFLDVTYDNGETPVTYSVSIQDISADGTMLYLNRNIPDIAPGVTVKAVVKRATLEDAILEDQFLIAKEDGFSIKAGATVPAEVADFAAPVVSAAVAVSYRALRQDLINDFTTITSYSNAQGKIGSLNINNPMSVAASIVNAAIGDLSYRILPIESDDNNGYMKALDILSTNERVYVIVPLTDDKDVISAFATHCSTQSMPEKSKWRIMYANMPMPITKVVIEYNGGQLAKGLSENTVFLKDTANGVFVTNRCRVTDFVDIYNAKNAYQYSLQLLEVFNETVASASAVKWVRTSEGYVETQDVLEVNSLQDVNYEVVRVLDTQGMCEAIGGIAESFKNKRLRYVMPDTIMLNVNSVDELCPSYYLCVALGAMRAGLPPHQGFSTMGISGIKRVLRSNLLFTEDQLAEMAGRGVFWVCQDAPEELPYVLYQTTTDNGQLEVSEDSIVAVIDYASKYYKNNLKNVLGRYNVNSISVNYVTNVINACTDDMVSTSYQYIGPIITSGTLLGIETDKDKIKPTIRIEVPYPVNGVDVTLQV